MFSDLFLLHIGASLPASMASLTRGISFRRQGSSGMSWTDSWAFNEEGVLVRTTSKDEGHGGQRFGGSALSRIHDLQDEEEAGASAAAAAASACPPSPAALGRSKSVGSAPAASVNAPHQLKSGLGLLKWIKKTFSKFKK